MSLSEQDRREMYEDGCSAARRDAFRAGRDVVQPRTFEDYLAMLDDLQQLAPPPPRPPFIRYMNVKL